MKKFGKSDTQNLKKTKWKREERAIFWGEKIASERCQGGRNSPVHFYVLLAGLRIKLT